MMKKAGVSAVLGIALCALVFVLCGCEFFNQPGETAAEGHRRHLRNVRLQRQQMMRDVDYLLLTEEPSKLSDKRLP
jgi:hypothetical protein